MAREIHLETSLRTFHRHPSAEYSPSSVIDRKEKEKKSFIVAFLTKYLIEKESPFFFFCGSPMYIYLSIDECASVIIDQTSVF